MSGTCPFDRKWSLLTQEIADKSRLVSELSVTEKAGFVRNAFEDTLELGLALGFGRDECRDAFSRIFCIQIPPDWANITG
jgi:hypothetical protein